MKLLKKKYTDIEDRVRVRWNYNSEDYQHALIYSAINWSSSRGGERGSRGSVT